MAFACFHTGLVTPLQEPIFMLFSRNDHTGADAQPWRFRAFRRAGEADLTCFPTLPERASYFESPSEAVFDADRDVRVNIAHMVQEHRERLPECVRDMNDYQVMAFLQGVVGQARERVRQNHRTSVPQYFNGRLQFLLPLSFERPDRVDLVLAAEAHDDFYRATTCLTLAMAYSNARLLGRPDQAWLLGGASAPVARAA